MFLIFKPTVTVINEEYEILLSSKESGIFAIEVGEDIYFEENSGVLSSEKNYAKIRIPQKALDKAKKYTVIYKKSLERVAYWSKMGKQEREEFSFKPVKRRGKINAYHLADIHGEFELAKAAASYFGSKTDIFILNGDYCEFDTEQDYSELLKFTGELTDGRIPVILVRGNHDTRGTLAERYTDRLTSNGKDTYFTFKAGWLSGIALDLGEDKEDECIEYGGVNNFYDFRRRETSFLKSLKARKSKYLFAVSHSSPAYNTERRGDKKFDIEDGLFTEWNKELECIGIKFMIIGHIHRSFFLKKNDERSRRPHSYPIIVGSECVARSGDFSGTALTFSADVLTARITNTKREIKKECKINLITGELCEE